MMEKNIEICPFQNKEERRAWFWMRSYHRYLAHQVGYSSAIKYIHRNKEIFINVLNGYTLKDVGAIYGISGSRCRTIILKIMDMIEGVGLLNRSLNTISEMRGYKHRLKAIVNKIYIDPDIDYADCFTSLYNDVSVKLEKENVSHV